MTSTPSAAAAKARRDSDADSDDDGVAAPAQPSSSVAVAASAPPAEGFAAARRSQHAAMVRRLSAAPVPVHSAEVSLVDCLESLGLAGGPLTAPMRAGRLHHDCSSALTGEGVDRGLLRLLERALRKRADHAAEVSGGNFATTSCDPSCSRYRYRWRAEAAVGAADPAVPGGGGRFLPDVAAAPSPLARVFWGAAPAPVSTSSTTLARTSAAAFTFASVDQTSSSSMATNAPVTREGARVNAGGRSTSATSSAAGGREGVRPSGLRGWLRPHLLMRHLTSFAGKFGTCAGCVPAAAGAAGSPDLQPGYYVPPPTFQQQKVGGLATSGTAATRSCTPLASSSATPTQPAGGALTLAAAPAPARGGGGSRDGGGGSAPLRISTPPTECGEMGAGGGRTAISTPSVSSVPLWRRLFEDKYSSAGAAYDAAAAPPLSPGPLRYAPTPVPMPAHLLKQARRGKA